MMIVLFFFSIQLVLLFHCVFVATVSNLSPSGIPAVNGQLLNLSGALMPSVSSDPAAFVISTSCTPSVSAVSGTSTSSSGFGSSITVTVNAGGLSSGGAYLLCARWTPTSLYFTAGSVNILSFSSLKPSVLPVLSGTVQSIVMTGAGFLNVSGDGSAFMISSSACTGTPSSVVTSVNSVFSSSILISLSVVDSGSAAGVYSVCLRTSPATSYFSTGINVTIGV